MFWLALVGIVLSTLFWLCFIIWRALRSDFNAAGWGSTRTG